MNEQTQSEVGNSPAAVDPPLRATNSGKIDRFIRRWDAVGIWRAAVALFIVTFTIGLTLTYVVRPLRGHYEALGGEGYDGYLELGVSLARGHGYVFEPGGHKVFHRPPLYPVLLTPAAFLPEDGQRIYVAALNSALFAATSILVFRIALLLLGARAAAVAWLIFATTPPILATAKNAVSAISQAFVYTLMLCCWLEFYLRARRSERLSLRFVALLICACYAAIMCHGTMLAATAFLLVAFSVWALCLRRFRVLAATFLVAACLAVLVAPWTWRNYRVTGMAIPVAGNAGLAYFAGNAHWGITKPATILPDESRYAPLLRHAGIDQAPERAVRMYGFTNPEAEKLANARMKEHMREHPTDFARKVVLNAVEYYCPVIFYIIPPDGNPLREQPLAKRLMSRSGLRDIAWTTYDLVLITLAVGGAIVLWRGGKRAFAVCLVAAWIAYAAPYFPFLCWVGNSPYTFGTFPVMATLAAALLQRNNLRPSDCHLTPRRQDANGGA